MGLHMGGGEKLHLHHLLPFHPEDSLFVSTRESFYFAFILSPVPTVGVWESASSGVTA